MWKNKGPVMLRCGAWPNLGYRLDKPWVHPYTVNYKSDSRIFFVICISLTRFHSTQFGTVSCHAHCRSSTCWSTLWAARGCSWPAHQTWSQRINNLTVNLCALCSKRQLPFGVLYLFLPAFLWKSDFYEVQFNFELFTMFNTLSFFCHSELE